MREAWMGVRVRLHVDEGEMMSGGKCGAGWRWLTECLASGWVMDDEALGWDSVNSATTRE